MLKLLLPVPQAAIRLTTLSISSSICIYQSAPVMMIERFLEMIMRLKALSLGVVLILDLLRWSAGLVITAILLLAISATVLAILPPSTLAMIGVYQGVIVAILLPFGILDVNQATAYALLMFGGQLAVWAILGVMNGVLSCLYHGGITGIVILVR